MIKLPSTLVTAAAGVGLLLAVPAFAQSITVSPTGVNANAQGGTIQLLTFGGLGGYAPADACWCGELVAMPGDIGRRCDPATVFGCLPTRYDFSTASGSGAFTDVMSIPPSVARRAYQAALAGATSSFFYVRRFVSAAGGADQYVAVSCRMTGGGARSAFSFSSVEVAFETEITVMVVRPGEKLPAVRAEMAYNGTGRLMGRWEVVLPGDELPADEDLLTGASLPYEARTLQRRYTQVGTFNEFLSPVGRYTLAGPDPARLPTDLPGQYLILLRIECTDDREGDTDLTAVGAGPGIIHAGAVAAFPMPVLRYFVSGRPTAGVDGSIFAPADAAVVLAPPLVFTWPSLSADAVVYRIELETHAGESLLSAVVAAEPAIYRAPPLLAERAAGAPLRWRVIALDAEGRALADSAWRSFRFAGRGSPPPA